MIKILKKINVAVLMGGPSSEREISLITGKAVFDNLDKSKYQPALVEMGRDSKFYLINNSKKRRVLDVQNKDRRLFDVFFLALHGTPGEDGTIQGMLEALDITYTGSRTLSSALCMNKVYASQIYHANGLPFPQFIHFKQDGWKERRAEILHDVEHKVGYPAVLKPVDQGSAVGVYIIKNEKELVKMTDKTIKTYPWLMAQKFVKGKEATCGVLKKKNGELLALPPTHIKPNIGEFYDYKSKYKKGGSTHICPADFGNELNEQIQLLALQAHKALNCRGMSRTDIFVSDDGHLYILETNTIPGMTPTSLLPEAASQAGISFGKMLDMIIEASS